jgi:AraC-like DNA-binding protein
MRLVPQSPSLSIRANRAGVGAIIGDRDSTVGASFVEGLVDAVARSGVDRATLLAHAGLAAQDKAPAHARWPMSAVIALFESAAALTGRQDLGLEFARHVRPGTFHVLGYALMTCRTLGDAIDLAPHYRRLVFDIGYSEMRFVQRGDQARLGWHVVSRRLLYCRSLAESLIASWYSFGRWIAGTDLPLQEVLFVHEAAGDPQAYATFFGCPVRFGAGENTLVFSRSLLQTPLVHADETLHLAMRAQAQAELARSFSGSDLAQRLRQVLLTLMPKCEATLACAAGALHMSKRSLQRRLGEAGCTFQEVLDDVRKDMAVIYLRDPNLSALDVALLLGYAEQSSFTRAFRTWFSCSPSTWRAPGRGAQELRSAHPHGAGASARQRSAKRLQ